MDSLTIQVAPNSVTFFAIIFTVVINLDIGALENQAGLGHIHTTFLKNLPTLFLIELDLHNDIQIRSRYRG
jgi:hypothetical protein